MIRVLLSMTALVVMSLACTQAVVTPSPTAPSPTATAQPSPTPQPTATATADEVVRQVTIRAVVYIRAEADANSQDLGVIETGRTVELISCTGDWCNVTAQIEGEQVTGWVFRGCTSENPEGLLCEAR